MSALRNASLGAIPGRVVAQTLGRTQRDLDLDIGKAEIAVDIQCQAVELRDFRLDLVFGAENVAVVLRESAHAHDPVQRAGRLVAMACTEFAVTQREVAVAAQFELNTSTCPGQFIGFTAKSCFSDSVVNMLSLKFAQWPDFSQSERSRICGQRTSWYPLSW